MIIKVKHSDQFLLYYSQIKANQSYQSAYLQGTPISLGDTLEILLYVYGQLQGILYTAEEIMNPSVGHQMTGCRILKNNG